MYYYRSFYFANSCIWNFFLTFQSSPPLHLKKKRYKIIVTKLSLYAGVMSHVFQQIYQLEIEFMNSFIMCIFSVMVGNDKNNFGIFIEMVFIGGGGGEGLRKFIFWSLKGQKNRLYRKVLHIVNFSHSQTYTEQCPKISFRSIA